jgi:hypothetical protein
MGPYAVSVEEPAACHQLGSSHYEKTKMQLRGNAKDFSISTNWRCFDEPIHGGF